MTGPSQLAMENELNIDIAIATLSGAHELAKVKNEYGPESVAERFRWLEEDVNGIWLLLKISDEIIGWGVVVWPGRKARKSHPDIQDLYVKPEHRSNGQGTYLTGEIEQLVRKKGFETIALSVNPDDNVPAYRLYERLGYRHNGGPKYLDGVYGDYEDWVIDLEKRL